MRIFTRGLLALILTLLVQTQLSAKYLYKDEVIKNPNFQQEVEKLGSELFEKTGIRLILLMLKKLPDNINMNSYEKSVLENFSEPTIIMVFSELNSEIDIQTNDSSLYEYFNRKQVLSPTASAVQAFIVALVYADSWKHFNEIRKDYGGSIIPLIAGKAKPEQLNGKYAASMFNGYIDIAHQISTSKGVVLESDPGDANQKTLFYVKLFFYSFVIYGIVMYIRRKIYRRRNKNEQK